MSILKIGISSRALFDLNEGHKIYKKKGIEKYADYQRSCSEREKANSNY